MSDLPRLSTEEVLEATATPGLGPVALRKLLRHFGSWSAARKAGAADLAGLGLRKDGAESLRKGRTRFDPEQEIDRAKKCGVRIVTWWDAEFPRSLRDHDDLPLAIYVRGDLLERDALAVGVVGSRNSSVYGRMHAERLSYELAQAGFTVISGLAEGVDTAAHKGALKGKGRTIAVLGNGLAHLYPPENEELADDVARSGALVTELPMDAPPSAANFPPRNRIIAAFSLGVVVIEASRNSGALITARVAGEMGKEVFAVPGDIGRPQTRGVHRLIRDGAKLVESVEDIIEELGPLSAPLKVGDDASPVPDPRALLLNDVERAIFDLLDSTPKDIDLITQDTGFSPAQVASTLMVLELRRLAAQMPGKLYVRAGTFQR